MLRRAFITAVAALLVAACSSGPVSTSSPGGSGTPRPSAGSSASAGPSATPAIDPASTGRAFIDAIARGDGASAEAMEDDAMRSAAPHDKLVELWGQLTAQYGAVQGIGSVTTSSQPPFTNAAVPVYFTSKTVTLSVTISKDGRVSGLHVTKVEAPANAPSPSPAPYVNPSAFTERDVTVGSSPWALPGTISMPAGAGPFPAVILLAGSGPQDRNETIGPNMPLRDIAQGLASRGIAVLRYEKRTYAHQAEMAAVQSTITVREETTDDALAAVALLRGTSDIDASRIFLAGHSLGGYLAPRIAAQAPAGSLRGIVLLEAPSSTLEKLILAQVTYLLSLQGITGAAAEAQLSTLRAQIRLAESPSLTSSTPAAQLPLGIPAAYWLDLRTYDAPAVAASLSMPIFFSQGGRDYQVPPTELDGWKKALSTGTHDVTYRTYASMDHILLDGSGTPRPDEYTVAGHVDAQLVSDLAAWVLAH